jgi:endonuclease/exonuclease/phosphatase family metal-dependent hydrolase
LTRPRVHVKFGQPFNLPASEAATWTAAYRDARFTEAAQAVAAVIASINADVIALTEVGNTTDLAELNAAVAAAGATYPHTAVCDCTDSSTQQHVAVLSRFPLRDLLTAIPGRETYNTELDDPETEKDTGISKGLRVTFDAAGETIHLYVAHLRSERGGHETDAQRIAQASIIRRHYLPLVQAGEHVIVAGDLNDKRGQPTLLRIRGRDDIWSDLIQTGLAEYFDASEVDSRWTYEFQGTRQQIDHVLVSRSIRSDASIGTQILDHGNALASDHRPVVVSLGF